ncbi:MAG: hypothetical protein ACRDT8_19545, partial [Micromonosporaceae bacterium]
MSNWWEAQIRRFRPVAILLGALAAVNAVARLVVWQAGVTDDEHQMLVGLLASAIAALLCVPAGVRWAYRCPMSRVVADIGLAIVVAALLVVLVGPYFGGSEPLAEGFGFAARQFLFYGGVMAFGAMLGVLGVIAAGKDWKSRGYKRYE